MILTWWQVHSQAERVMQFILDCQSIMDSYPVGSALTGIEPLRYNRQTS